MKQLVAVLVALSLVLSSAQTPQTQPLVQQGDVRYLGKITAPPGIGNPNGMAVEGNVVWTTCYFGTNTAGVAKWTLPALGGTGILIHGCIPLPNLNQVHRGGTYLDIVPGGVLPWLGDIICSGWTYYDGGGGHIKGFWKNCDTTPQGPYQMDVTDVGYFSAKPVISLKPQSPLMVAELLKASPESFDLDPEPGPGLAPVPLAISWPRESMVAGYFGLVPAEWQTLLGGTALAGQCCVPIIGRTSFGPSVSVFRPGDIGNTPEPHWSKMLIGFPIEHHDLGDWGISPPAEYYGGTDQLGSVGFPAGTRSILFTGRHGETFCYGPGTANKALVGTPGPGAYAYCYDPQDSAQGNHGPLYLPTMWAFDANDVIAVKNGTAKPWDVRPYAKWTLPGMDINAPNYMRAGYYEQQTKRFYVGDTSTRDISVFEITIGGQPPPPPPPPSNANITVDPAVTHQTMRGWEVTAQMDQFFPQFLTYRDAVLDKVVEAGINRVRLEVRSGSENPVDYYGAWLAAGAQFSGTAYDTWRANRYTIINDNADPNTAAGSRFWWAELDDTTDRIVQPLRAKLAAKGESLYVNLTVVSFYNGQTQPNIYQTPSEYAEFVLEAFRHMQARYGWVPNGINLILEPDNTNNWSGTLLGQVAAATRTRLAAAGFTPDIIAPSTTNMTTASTWGPQALAVPGNGIKELSYHRYSNVTLAALQAIATASQNAGIGSSMLEWWDAGNNFNVLHEDITVGRASAWQQSVMVDTANPAGIAIAYVNLAQPTVATFTTPTQSFKQYYQGVRLGAVRVGATTTASTLAPIAFRNTNGRYTVVVKATAAGPISIAGLPAGTYGLTSTAGNAADQIIAAGGVVATNAVGAGVLTVTGKTGGPPPPPPPPVAPVAVADTYTGTGASFNQVAPGVLANDDLKGLTDVTAVLISGPPSGLTFSANGSFTHPAVSSPVTFAYQARSASAGASNTATVTLIPAPPPPPPVDTCVANPLVVSVQSWPSTVEGTRNLRYTATVAGLVVTIYEVQHFWTGWQRLVVKDSRGCVTTVHP